jgi:hypothetical protein
MVILLSVSLVRPTNRSYYLRFLGKQRLQIPCNRGYTPPTNCMRGDHLAQASQLANPVEELLISDLEHTANTMRVCLFEDPTNQF